MYVHFPMIDALVLIDIQGPGPEIIKLISCSTQLRMTFSMLINIKGFQQGLNLKFGHEVKDLKQGFANRKTKVKTLIGRGYK